MSIDETLPWSEKYRPKTFSDLVGPVVPQLEKISETPLTQVPHLIFYGPSGSGKNSTISILLKKMYGSHFETHTKFLNASDERGIDIIRNRVKELAQYHSDVSLPFFIIFDEADNLTDPAQQALRRTMEKFPKNSRFGFLCNHLSNLNFAIQSRAEKFHFARLSEEQTTFILERIAQKEEVKIEKKLIMQIADYSNGDLRAGINLLQFAATRSKIMGKPITSSCLIYLSGDIPETHWTSLISPLSNEERFRMAQLFFDQCINFKYVLKRLKKYVVAQQKDDAQIAKFLVSIAELEREMLKHIPVPLLFQILIFTFQDCFFVSPLD